MARKSTHDPLKLMGLMSKLSTGRVFVSMPVTPVTPETLLLNPKLSAYSKKQGITRLHGILKFSECALSVFDHGNLYGDGIFEGILITHGQVYRLDEHLSRLTRSAKQLGITLPYSPAQFSRHILDTIKEAGIKKTETAYIRLVVTRGIGNLGIDPRKCISPTVYIIVSKISLYPKERYTTGISMSVAKNIRRPDKSLLDPTVKSLNYLNNIQALREGVINNPDPSVMEVLLLTHRGYVSEASADNLFIVDKSTRPATLITAVDEYALCGITRQFIIDSAKKIKLKVKKSRTILPEDLLGADKEVFLTGTAAGVMPVVKFDGKKIGNAKPGTITKKLIGLHRKDQKNPKSGLKFAATDTEIKRYLC